MTQTILTIVLTALKILAPFSERVNNWLKEKEKEKHAEKITNTKKEIRDLKLQLLKIKGKLKNAKTSEERQRLSNVYFAINDRIMELNELLHHL